MQVRHKVRESYLKKQYINAQDIGMLQVASKKPITAHIPIQGLCRFLKTKS